MATDRVKKLDIGVKPAAGVSGAHLIASEYSTYLTFNAVSPDDDGRYHDAGVAVLHFPRCIKAQFGHPNDEALPGHPLAAHGLSYYDVFEGEESSWLDRVCKENRVAFPKVVQWGEGLRHFVVTFHDSTFECLAREVTVELYNMPHRHVLAGLVKRIGDE